MKLETIYAIYAKPQALNNKPETRIVFGWLVFWIGSKIGDIRYQPRIHKTL